MTHLAIAGTLSSFSLCSLLLLGGLCGQLKSDFRPELGINLLQLCNQMLNVIAMVEQNRDLRNVDRFRLEIVDVQDQHLQQSRIIGDISRGAVGKEGKSQSIHGKMPLNPIRCFVKTKTF